MSETDTAGSEPIHVESEAHLRDLVAENDVVLVDFHADWCGPCKMLEPTVKEIAAETDAVVAKVDIDELQELARNESVRSVPTLQFYAGGERAERFVGVQSKEKLLETIESLG
jgi:thioredoxin 1